jgi:hypothetical protein
VEINTTEALGTAEKGKAVPSELQPFVDAKAPGLTTVRWKLVSERLRVLQGKFENRRDWIAIAKPWSGLAAVAPGIPFLEEAPAHRLMHREELPEDTDPESEIRRAGRTALILGHLVGEIARPVHLACKKKDGTISAVRPSRYRVGFYTPDRDAKTKWLCIDFDGAGHAQGHALHDPLDAVLQTKKRALDVGLVPYIERSYSGRGFHLWVFFETKVDVEKARKLGLALAPRDAKLADGGVADPMSGKGIEVFPKSKGTELGSQVWAPWFHGAASGANCFVNATPEGCKETDTCSLQ